MTRSPTPGTSATAPPGSTAANPAHTYTTAGNYAAQLTVSDGKGNSDTETVTISVGNSGAHRLDHRAGGRVALPRRRHRDGARLGDRSRGRHAAGVGLLVAGPAPPRQPPPRAHEPDRVPGLLRDRHRPRRRLVLRDPPDRDRLGRPQAHQQRGRAPADQQAHPGQLPGGRAAGLHRRPVRRGALHARRGDRLPGHDRGRRDLREGRRDLPLLGLVGRRRAPARGDRAGNGLHAHGQLRRRTPAPRRSSSRPRPTRGSTPRGPRRASARPRSSRSTRARRASPTCASGWPGSRAARCVPCACACSSATRPGPAGGSSR